MSEWAGNTSRRPTWRPNHDTAWRALVRVSTEMPKLPSTSHRSTDRSKAAKMRLQAVNSAWCQRPQRWWNTCCQPTDRYEPRPVRQAPLGTRTRSTWEPTKNRTSDGGPVGGSYWRKDQRARDGEPGVQPPTVRASCSKPTRAATLSLREAVWITTPLYTSCAVHAWRENSSASLLAVTRNLMQPTLSGGI